MPPSGSHYDYDYGYDYDYDYDDSDDEMVTMQENWLRQKEELKAWAAAQGGSTDLHKVLKMPMMMSMMILIMILMMMMMASIAQNEPINDK